MTRVLATDSLITSLTWAVRLDVADASSLARLRCRSLQVCEAAGSIWLSGSRTRSESEGGRFTGLGVVDLVKRPPSLALRVRVSTNRNANRGSDSMTSAELLALPAHGRFTVLPDRQLVADGCLVPSGYLPDGPWIPIADFVRVESNVPRLAGQVGSSAVWKLVRSNCVTEPNAMLISLMSWHDYGVTAPQVRLDRWRFAANDTGDVVVWGAPPPPLPGCQFVEDHGIAIPAGWELSPRLDPRIVRELTRAEIGDLVLLHPDGTYDVITGSEFVKAKRSAIRATAHRESEI